MNFPVADDPADDISVLTGQDANGTWTLRSIGVTNGANFDAFLKSWTLTLTCTVN